MPFPTLRCMAILSILSVMLAACGTPTPAAETEPAVAGLALGTAAPDQLPALAAVDLAAGEKLQVVATTTLIADVAGQVGGDAIDLYTLLPPGADPHSYQPTPQDLRRLTDAHVILVNGLGLEASLAPALQSFTAKIVVVNSGLETLEFGDEEHTAEGDGHDHTGPDPHTWFNVDAVALWTKNIAQVLGDLDPANAQTYRQAAERYGDTLAALRVELAAQMAQIPADRRKLVTDHDSLGYLAAAYDLEIIGSVIPATSTLAEPSAQALAAIQDLIVQEGVEAIFVGTTVSQQLERQLAQDLGIAVVPIYTGSLSEPGGPAGTYVDFMRYNVGAIVAALQGHE